MDGEHSIEQSFEATSRTLHAVFAELVAQRVRLEEALLKPNMVLPGYACPAQASFGEVAEWTLRCLRRHVPAALPGIVFLSGGQSDEDATAQPRCAQSRRAPDRGSCRSRSVARCRQPRSRRGAGSAANVAAAQDAFRHRAAMNGAARIGLRTAPDMETQKR